MSDTLNSSLKSAVKGTTLVFSGMVASILIWFVSKVLIVRYTTTEELGIYSLAVAIASVAGVIAAAGLQDGSTRYVSLYLGEGKPDRAAAAGAASISVGMVLGALATTLLFAFSSPISQHMFYMPSLYEPLRAISFFAFFYVFSNVLLGVIRGYGDIRPMVYFIIIGQPLIFLVLLCVCLLLDMPFIGIIYSYVLALAAPSVLAVVYGRVKVGITLFRHASGGIGWEILKFSLPLLGTAVMGMLFNWTDTLMLGRYEDAEAVGIYSVSISLVRLLTFTFSAAGFVYMPIAADMYSRRRMSELGRTYQVLTKWVFSATLPIFFILFFFPDTTVRFIFGEGFGASSVPLMILSLGYMTNVLVGVNGVLLIVLGLSGRLFQISVAGSTLNIVLNYLFIKRFGMGLNGAALATTVSFAAVSLMTALLLYSVARIQPITGKYLRPVAVSAIIGLLLYIAAKGLPFYFWMMPIYLLLFVLGYGAAILVTKSLDREDIELFEAISRRTGLRMEPIRRLIGRFAGDVS